MQRPRDRSVFKGTTSFVRENKWEIRLKGQKEARIHGTLKATVKILTGLEKNNVMISRTFGEGGGVNM